MIEYCRFKIWKNYGNGLSYGKVCKQQFDLLHNEMAPFEKGADSTRNLRYEVEFPMGSVEGSRILLALKRIGLQPRWETLPHINVSGLPSHYFQVGGCRDFEKSDFDAAMYVSLSANKLIGSIDWDASRRLSKPCVQLQFETKIGNISPSVSIVCSKKVQQLLSKNIPEVRWLTLHDTNGSSIDYASLSSWIQLPPSQNKWLTWDGNLSLDGLSARYIDDPFSPPLLKFNNCEIERRPFQIAVTHEHHSPLLGDWTDRYVIIHRKVKEWLEDQDLGLDFQPVALE